MIFSKLPQRMEMMRKVRIGVIGTGGIFESHSRGFLINNDLVDVVAVSARSYNDESRKRVSRLLEKSENDIQYFTDYNEMLDKAESMQSTSFYRTIYTHRRL